MVDTAEDNYRIEVWESEEEKTLLETISKSSDFAVSMVSRTALEDQRG